MSNNSNNSNNSNSNSSSRRPRQMLLTTTIIPATIPTVVAIIIIGLIGYYVYYLYTIEALTIAPFLKYEELIFMYDYTAYKDKPSEFVKSFVTVAHFWMLIASIICYFVLLTKLFNPFPLPSSSGVYVFMLDANRLHVLRLKETYSKLFIWRKKAYFLPTETLRYGNCTILVYLSNINVAVNMLRISKEDVEMMIKTLVNYVYSYEAYTNKIGKHMPLFPRDVLRRNYQIFVNMDDKTIEIYHTNERCAYKVTRFVSADLFFIRNENVTKIDEAKVSPSLVLGELEVPLLVQQNDVYEGRQQQKSRAATTVAKSSLAKIYSYIDYGMNITNPYLTYDILRGRRIIINLYKYFVGSFTSKVLPLVLIAMIIIILIIFFPQLQSMISPSTTTLPPPTQQTTP